LCWATDTSRHWRAATIQRRREAANFGKSWRWQYFSIRAWTFSGVLVAQVGGFLGEQGGLPFGDPPGQQRLAGRGQPPVQRPCVGDFALRGGQAAFGGDRHIVGGPVLGRVGGLGAGQRGDQLGAQPLDAADQLPAALERPGLGDIRQVADRGLVEQPPQHRTPRIEHVFEYIRCLRQDQLSSLANCLSFPTAGEM
jgi:hypothetical protein